MRGAAIAQDWMVVEAGAERVTLELARLLPSAPVYTSFFEATGFKQQLDPMRVRPWPVQRALGPSKHFRSFLPLYPLYFGTLSLKRYELVVSSSVAFTHAVRTAPRALHISYVHTPMRYAWDLDAYLGDAGFSRGARVAARALRGPLQRWDRATRHRPQVLVANSQTVRERIQRVWDRDADVIHPPVDVAGIDPSSRDDGYLLAAARMLPYRRLDIAIRAANELKRDLVLVGDGPDRRRLESLAGPTVQFTGRLDRSGVVDAIRRCHAYVVPGVEDFGIAPIEAMAAGKPVVAIRAGGTAETVVDGATGILFEQQSVDAVVGALERLDRTSLDARVIRARAEEFGTDVFFDRFRALFERLGVDRSLYA